MQHDDAGGGPLRVVLRERPVLIVPIAGMRINVLAVSSRDDGFVIEDPIIVPVVEHHVPWLAWVATIWPGCTPTYDATCVTPGKLCARKVWLSFEFTQGVL
jgi:hypothetical protein